MFETNQVFAKKAKLFQGPNEGAKVILEAKKGDKVVTKSGLHGKVLELNDDGTCIIESGAGKMKYERSAISMELSKKQNAPAK